MGHNVMSGYQELVNEWRQRRDGKDCTWNVIATVVEARGLRGIGNHGLNDCKLKVTLSSDPDEGLTSKIHQKTSTPFFNHVFKLSFSGQPAAFFGSIVQVEVLHDRGVLFPPKLIGMLRIGILDIFHMHDHKLPLQWLPIVDLGSEEPSVPRGYLRMNLIINSLDESGAVQSDVPPVERSQTELLVIPRLHACATSTGIYNIIFKVYQACDLRRMDQAWGADPYVKISCSTGEMLTDNKTGTLNPVWNQQLQLPVYEPLFRELIFLEIWHANVLGHALMSSLLFTWKDVVSNQESFKQVRWYDMYEQPQDQIGTSVLKAVKWVARKANIRTGPSNGIFQEASVYCGRILLSVFVENREGDDKPPSLAQTDLKPKDCKFFQDVPQKTFFRLQIFFAQGLAVPFPAVDSVVQVELTIGRKSAASKAITVSDNGLFEWYESIELEMDFLYDDAKWPWTSSGPGNHYDDGLIPAAFIDEGMPDAWIRVYRCNPLSYNLGKWANEGTRKLIGFTRCSVRELLNLGAAHDAGANSATMMESVHGGRNSEDRKGELKVDKRNLILNKKGSSQPAFFLKDAEDLPAAFDPRKFQTHYKCSLKKPAWPAPREEDDGLATKADFPQFDDGRDNLNSMDPYIGVQCFDLKRDGTCALGDSDFPGRIWLSCKCYLPSRDNCKNALKGPPILSPFTKYNAAPIPRPKHMADCLEYFSLRCHVFQARDLQGTNEVGLAHAYVEVRFMGRSAKTHVVHGSNSPTWDTTLWGGGLNMLELPCLGWPGKFFEGDPNHTKYDVNADPGDDYDEATWRRNQGMLFFIPWIELRVVDAGEILLGRCFVNPAECRHTLQDPEWYELFKGNPELDEGRILVSIQLIHKADPLLTLPAYELCPIRTEQPPETDEDFLWDRDRVGTHIEDDKTKTKTVTMRDCRVQVQILGLRNVDPSLELKNPSLAVFVQTTDEWNADKGFGCVFTQEKGGDGDHNNQNFMEQLELRVQLPDDIEYAPALEFVLLDDRGLFSWTKKREVVAWGSIPFRQFHPQGNDKAELDAEEEEEDVAALQRQNAKELRKNFKQILEDLETRQTILLPDSRKLKKAYDDKDDEEKVREVVKLYVSSPSEVAFLEQSEDYMLGNERSHHATKKPEAKTAAANDAEEQNQAEHQNDDAIDANHAEAGPPDGPVHIEQPQLASAVTDVAVGIHSVDVEVLKTSAQTAELDEGDLGPTNDDIHAADNPQEASARHLAGDGEADAIGDGHGEDTAFEESGANQVKPEDDEDADRQEDIDTPDGKPNAEWLIFRRNKLYTQPLEETQDQDWAAKLKEPFEEISLFRGKIPDYKRREASNIGLIKCKVKIFRKEDANAQGKSKRSLYTKDATYYETLASDPSVEKALELARPYRMYNIYELYPDWIVDVRLYCLKAVQVTPGGLQRVDQDGSPYWCHYLECRLGSHKYESDVDSKLNPNFFYTFEIKGVPLPGPSQLILALRDGNLKDGKISGSELVGETVIDLEDRWFCPEWRDLLHKPREVRDLINESLQPGISQGKILIVLDLLDENQTEDKPPMDIQVMGKTLPMEMRVIIWDTKDTAAKDGYTSDVYIRGEMLGLGEPKVTDTHYGVKLKAFGMFNYRLKWRCKYPLDGVDYLFRIGIWDENLLTAHQCIAEGVLPLRSLFEECFEKNQGKTSPDEMEVVSLQPIDDAAGSGGYQAGGEDGIRYPYRWYTLLHPSFGFNPQKDAQAKLKITIQVLPRAKARANPAGPKRNGPAALSEPNRPPQPANPILESEKCKAYIVYSIKECFLRCRTPCIFCCCCLIVAVILGAVVGVKMALT